MRNAEVGRGNTMARVVARDLTMSFRVPPSAFFVLAALACTPVTTRPPFFPDPRAPVVTLNARPEPVTIGIDSLVRAESLEVAHINVRDYYVETAWYDTKAHRSAHHEREIHDLETTIKIRFWADPWVPGQTRLTVEPVYRPRVDPSRRERDLEVVLSKDDEGYKIAMKLLEKLKKRFGVPKAAAQGS